MGNDSKCCGDDKGEDFTQVEGAGRSCCYNGAVLAHGNHQGAILCQDGLLYNCNSAATDDSNRGVGRVTCDQVGTLYCAASNTWTDTACPAIPCDDFDRSDGTWVGAWTERAGNWALKSGRLATPIGPAGWGQHITKDDSSRADGCINARAIHGGGTQARWLGLIARWTGTNSYITGIIQDNESSGKWDSIYFYQLPVGSSAQYRFLDLGTDANIQLAYQGTAVTFRVDKDRDGTWDEIRTTTAASTGAGLTGVFGGGHGPSAFVDDFCFGDNCAQGPWADGGPPPTP